MKGQETSPGWCAHRGGFTEGKPEDEESWTGCRHGDELQNPAGERLYVAKVTGIQAYPHNRGAGT